MKISKKEIKLIRCKVVVFGLLVALLGVIGYRGWSKGVGYGGNLDFGESTVEASIVLKAHYLSIVKGACEKSDMSGFIRRFENSVSGILENRDSKAGLIGLSLLRILKIYQQHKSSSALNNHFWAVLLEHLDQKETSDILNFKRSSLSGSEKRSWSKAVKDLELGRGKELLGDTNDGGVLHLASKDQDTVKVVLAFEEERLASHLTAEDQMLIRILEKKVILKNQPKTHTAWSEPVCQSLSTPALHKDKLSSHKIPAGLTVHQAITARAQSIWKVKPVSHESFSNGQSHFSETEKPADDTATSETANADTATGETATGEATTDDGQSPEKETVSEKEKREQLEKEKKKEERIQKRRTSRAKWQAEEEELRKHEQTQLDKLEEGSDEYDDLALKFRNERKERRIKIFHELWGNELEAN